MHMLNGAAQNTRVAARCVRCSAPFERGRPRVVSQVGCWLVAELERSGGVLGKKHRTVEVGENVDHHKLEAEEVENHVWIWVIVVSIGFPHIGSVSRRLGPRVFRCVSGKDTWVSQEVDGTADSCLDG
jgi:hypothetical protein